MMQRFTRALTVLDVCLQVLRSIGNFTSLKDQHDPVGQPACQLFISQMAIKRQSLCEEPYQRLKLAKGAASSDP